jgi:hypothetical protein
MGFTVAVRTALAAVLTAALLATGAARDEQRIDSDGAISVAHAAVAASSSVAEPAPVSRALVQPRAPFIVVSQSALEPACARPLPEPVAPDVQSLRPDVVTCPSRGPPRPG